MFSMILYFRHNTDGDNWIICREINKDNTSKWSVNKRHATQKSVSAPLYLVKAVRLLINMTKLRTRQNRKPEPMKLSR